MTGKYLKTIIVVVILIMSLTVNAFAANSEKNVVKGKIKLENDVIIHYEMDESKINSSKNAKASITASQMDTKYKTVNGYFYLTSNGKKVAEYSVIARFKYDGERVWGDACNAVEESLVNGWKIRNMEEDWGSLNNDTLGYCRGGWVLSYNGEVNNTSSIAIYCDVKGNITYEHN